MLVSHFTVYTLVLSMHNQILAVLMAVGLCCCIVGAKDQYTTV